MFVNKLTGAGVLQFLFDSSQAKAQIPHEMSMQTTPETELDVPAMLLMIIEVGKIKLKIWKIS